MNNYSQMVSDLAKPGEDIIATLTPALAHTLHMAVGLAGEAGELLEHFVDLETDALTTDSELLEEFGDSEFYYEGLCQSMHVEIPMSGQHVGVNDALAIPRYGVAASNLLDVVKKIVIYNKEVDIMVFVDALTKVRLYLDRAYSTYGLTQAEALEHNMNKLLKGDTARYKEGTYSDEAAQARRDKQEVRYAIGDYNGKGGYAMWAGPTPNLNMLKLEEGKSENSCILSFDNRGEETIVARWNELLGCWQDHEPQ